MRELTIFLLGCVFAVCVISAVTPYAKIRAWKIAPFVALAAIAVAIYFGTH